MKYSIRDFRKPDLMLRFSRWLSSPFIHVPESIEKIFEEAERSLKPTFYGLYTTMRKMQTDLREEARRLNNEHLYFLASMIEMMTDSVAAKKYEEQ